MSNKLTVNQSGPWKLYTNTLPEGATPLGTVTRDTGEVGALAQIAKTGAYVQVNAGTVRSLDGRSVAAALGKSGPQNVLNQARRVQVYLDADTIAFASSLGGGNVSQGIRAMREALADKGSSPTRSG